MTGLTPCEPRPIAHDLGDTAALEVDTSIYSLPAILRSAYKLTDRCYVFVHPLPGTSEVVVTLTTRSHEVSLSVLVGELCNELIDQQIREDLSARTAALRDMIVAQAFAEGNLLDPLRDEASHVDDPLGIGR